MVSHLQRNARGESLQRQREDWKRATHFIESEIAMSGRIVTTSEAVSIPTGCDLQSSEIKLVLDLPRELPLVLYGISALNSSTSDVDRSQWIGEGQDDQNFGLLIRCDPNLKLTSNGDNDYDGTSINQTVILDGIDKSTGGHGLNVKVHDSKSASFSLALKGLANSRFSGNPIYFG